MMNNYIRVEFCARPENEKFARSAAAAYVTEMDPTCEELAEIKTAVSEAVSNAVIHGYAENPEGIITMELKKDERENIYITVSDNGKGIENVQQAREPLFTTGNPQERSGMGFTVMESFMEKVFVESIPGVGTRVSMVKKIGDKEDKGDKGDRIG